MTRGGKKTSIWNIFFSYLNVINLIASGFLLVPVYISILGSAQYGSWLALSVAVGWLGFLDLGLAKILVIKISQEYQNGIISKKFSGILSIGLMISFILSAMVLLVGLMAQKGILSYLNIIGANNMASINQAYLILVIATSLLVLSHGINAINLGMQSSLGVGIIFNASMSIGIISTFILLKNNFGIESMAFGALIQSILILLGNIFYLGWRRSYERIKINFDPKELRLFIRDMSFNFISNLFNTVSSGIDVLVLSKFFGSDLVSIYTLNKRPYEMVKTFIDRPSMALIPSLSSLFSINDLIKLDKYIKYIFLYTIWGIGLFSSGLILLGGDFIKLWVGSELYAGSYIGILLLLGMITSCLLNVFLNIHISYGEIKNTSLVNIIQSSLSIAMILLLGIKYGIVGVAYSLIISNLLLFVLISLLDKIRIINKNSFFIFIRECVVSAISVSIIILIFKNTILFGWINLFICAFKISLLYIILLFFLSKEFRFSLNKMRLRLLKC